MRKVEILDFDKNNRYKLNRYNWFKLITIIDRPIFYDTFIVIDHVIYIFQENAI